jgi:BirA family biotin operon repressor/biotin-[acetyl-CoA-carboxylase] ligase
MPPGNFAATLVIRPAQEPGVAALRSFVACLAVFDAVVSVSGRSDGLALKWPNDVLLNGGKMAIGIGVNLAAAPDVNDVEARALRPVSLLSEAGAEVSPEEFLDHLAAAYARYEAQFTQFGFAPIREVWLARAARLGETITARTGNAETVGTFADVDKDGHLVLETAKGRVNIPAADVFF